MNYQPAYTNIADGLAALDRIRDAKLAEMEHAREERRRAYKTKRLGTRPGARGRVHGKRKKVRR